LRGALLLVDDDETFAYAVAERLRHENVTVSLARTVAEAIAMARLTRPTAAVIDHELPDGKGVELAATLLSTAEQPLAVIMLTAFGTVEGAVTAMKAGCVDYMKKEGNVHEIVSRLRRALELPRSRARAPGRVVCSDATAILGGSPAVRELKEQIEAAASAPSTTVLIEGESGTGKQLVARAIHASSSRRARAYVEVDCATFATALMESELFGHERGAFTGADQRKLGLVEAADGGSLLLDEIGELEVSSQCKLLRLIQERTFRRVGSTQDRSVDVRIIASTNRRLMKDVGTARFREDLYYRLRVFVINVPPLRERRDDIIVLAEHFLAELGPLLGKPGLRLTGGAMDALLAHDFPGNIRELRATIEQALIRARGMHIAPELLLLDPRRRPASEPPPISWRQRGRPRDVLAPDEVHEIKRAMTTHFGNQSKAAAALGISRFALKRKLLLIRQSQSEVDGNRGTG
jgi:two-component system, NtrC family, response regulator AtoC